MFIETEIERKKVITADKVEETRQQRFRGVKEGEAIETK